MLIIDLKCCTIVFKTILFDDSILLTHFYIMLHITQ